MNRRRLHDIRIARPAFLALLALLTILPIIASAPIDRPDPELFAKVTTSKGAFRFRLHPKEAPLTVTNFCNLAQQGFFDGLPIYGRTFVIRTTGRAAPPVHPDWTFRREFSGRLDYGKGGVVGMDKLGDGANATTHPTQWFVTVKAQERWHLDFPVFGTVTEGQGVVDGLEVGDIVTSVVIEGDPAPLYEKHAAQRAQWNEALARSGWKRPASGDAPSSSPPAAAPPPPATGRRTAT